MAKIGDMEEKAVGVWNFPAPTSLTMALKRFILWGAPLSFLGLVGVISWQWYRGRWAPSGRNGGSISSSASASASSNSQPGPAASSQVEQHDSASSSTNSGGSTPAAGTATVERQSNSPSSVDSGVMEEGSGSSQGSSNSRKTSSSEETSSPDSDDIEVKPTPLTSHLIPPAKQMASSNLRMPSIEAEVPLTGAAPVASVPPITPESYSEMEDSATSSEGILTGSQTSKSPGYYDQRTDVLPRTADQADQLNNVHKKPDQPSPFAAASRDIRYYPDAGAPPPPVDKGPAVQDPKDSMYLCKKDRIRVLIQIPRDVIGRFIGKLGRNIKSLMADSNGASVYVNQKNAPKDASTVLCTVQGSVDQVSEALKIIEVRYPEIEVPDYRAIGPANNPAQLVPPTPSLNFVPPQAATTTTEIGSWEVELKPAFIPTASFSGMVCYIENLTNVWLVLVEKSSLLDQQHHSMSYTYCYGNAQRKDHVAKPKDGNLLGKFCAVRVSEIHWLRGRVSRFGDDLDCYEVKLVDYGSVVVVPPSAIKPLRKEHCLLPVQAFKSRLAHVEAKDGVAENSMVKLQQMVEGVELEVHITGILSLTSPLNNRRGSGTTPLSSSSSSSSAPSPLPATSEGSRSVTSSLPPRADATPFMPSQPSTGVSPTTASTSPDAKPARVPSPEGANLILKRLVGGSVPEGEAAEPNEGSPPEEEAKEQPETTSRPVVEKEVPAEGKGSAVSPSPGEEREAQLSPLAPYIPVVELYAQVGQTPTFVNRELVELGFATWKEESSRLL